MVKIDVNVINELIRNNDVKELKQQMKHLAEMNTKSRLISLINLIDNCNDVSALKEYLGTMFKNELLAIKLVNKDCKTDENSAEHLTEKALKIFKSENWEIF